MSGDTTDTKMKMRTGFPETLDDRYSWRPDEPTGAYFTDGRTVVDESGLSVADFSVVADAHGFVGCVNAHDVLVEAVHQLMRGLEHTKLHEAAPRPDVCRVCIGRAALRIANDAKRCRTRPERS